MSESPKYTVQLDEEAVKEIKDQVFRDFRNRWDIINKENIELKREIQELKSENKKLIEMGIDLSNWIYSLAKYSNDAKRKLKTNAWFEGVEHEHFNEVVYGGNK